MAVLAKPAKDIGIHHAVGVRSRTDRDDQHAAPVGERLERGEILIRNVAFGAAEIADLSLEGGDARGDLAADLAETVDPDLAAAHPLLRTHQRRRLQGGPVALADI